MNIPPPLIAAIGAVFLIIVTWLLPGLAWPFWGGGLIGLVVFVTGTVLAMQAARGFFRAKTTIRPDELEKVSTLVTAGPYRYTRNPMYLGLALAIAGVGIWLGSLATPVAVGVFVWVINTRQIEPEEAALENKFGQDFADYKQRVRRWV
jgi:protein-S-isoprenylcysteine O-methyltransferase Ste14